MCNFSSCQKGGVLAIPDFICLFTRHEIEARSPSAHCNREIMKHYSFPSIPFSFSPLYCPGWRARVCPWAFHKLLEIFQFLKKLLQKKSKLARENKNGFWSDAKICKLYNKLVTFLSIFVQFCGVTSVTK